MAHFYINRKIKKSFFKKAKRIKIECGDFKKQNHIKTLSVNSYPQCNKIYLILGEIE